jgi:hypothetical protein
MPILSGLAATDEIHRLMPGVPILMLSMHDGKDLLDALRVAGAQGFVPNAKCANKLLEAVDKVAFAIRSVVTPSRPVGGRGSIIEDSKAVWVEPAPPAAIIEILLGCAANRMANVILFS